MFRNRLRHPFTMRLHINYENMPRAGAVTHIAPGCFVPRPRGQAVHVPDVRAAPCEGVFLVPGRREQISRFYHQVQVEVVSTNDPAQRQFIWQYTSSNTHITVLEDGALLPVVSARTVVSSICVKASIHEADQHDRASGHSRIPTICRRYLSAVPVPSVTCVLTAAADGCHLRGYHRVTVVYVTGVNIGNLD